MAGKDAKHSSLPESRETARYEAGILGPVASLLHDSAPSLLLLANAAGRLIAWADLGQQWQSRAVRNLAKDMVARLSGGQRQVQAFTVQTKVGYRLGFAVRLPAAANAVLGGLVELSEASEDRLHAMRVALVACGTALWTALDAKRAVSDLEAQLSRATRLQTIGQLTAGIVHEINVPAQYVRDNTRFVEDAFDKVQTLLAACLDLHEAARKKVVGKGAVAGVVAAVERANLPYLMREIPAALGQSLEGLDSVTRLVRSMNEYAHGGVQDKQAVDLNRVVEAAITVCRSQWKHVADAVTDLDPTPPVVACVPGDVQEVLINLIINAAHAIEDKLGETTTDKGTITVRTRRGDDWVEIRVEDTGAGIPEEIRHLVFDRFFTTKKPERGTGQGLAIARSIIADRYGGTMTFTSQVGQGTAFVVRIPSRPETVVCEISSHEETDPVC